MIVRVMAALAFDRYLGLSNELAGQPHAWISATVF